MSEPTGLPAHFCDEGQPSPDCPGCNHQVNRFPELYFDFLDLVTSQDPTEETEARFHAIGAELRTLGLLAALWYHSACVVTQLAHDPVTVNREQAWAHLMDQSPHLAGPVLDLCDELLTAAATDDRDRATLVCRDLIARPEQVHHIVHLTLAELVEEQTDKHLSIWQQVAYRSMLHDVWEAIGHPHEILLAARICGALLDHDGDQFHQLLNRAGLSQMIDKLVIFWARAAAQHLGPGAEYAIVRVRDGNLDALLNLHADLSESGDAHERAFLIAERIIRTMADKDATVGASVPQIIAAEPDLLRHVIAAVAQFHSQVLYAIYGEMVRKHLDQDP